MTESAGSAQKPSLSIVIPVYNESPAMQSLIPHLRDQFRGSAWRNPEIIVVDDGSTDGTREVLVDQADDVVRVIHQSNHGRLAARRTGLMAARNDYVLFMDARVRITSGFHALVDRIAEGMTVWNAHVDIAGEAGLLGAFWDSPTRIFWHEYFNNPRRVSFGAEDYHRYPKGTTGFLAPRTLLVEAFDSFTSSYADPRNANDDTAVLQHVAARTPIWISPEFTVSYTPRHSIRKFMPHAYHRGIVFVDGFLHRGNPYAAVIVAFYALSGAMVPLSRRRRWLLPAAYVGVTGAAVTAGVYRGLSTRHLKALALITPLFVTSYGAGMWVGLGLRLRNRMPV